MPTHKEREEEPRCPRHVAERVPFHRHLHRHRGKEPRKKASSMEGGEHCATAREARAARRSYDAVLGAHANSRRQA